MKKLLTLAVLAFCLGLGTMSSDIPIPPCDPECGPPFPRPFPPNPCPDNCPFPPCGPVCLL